MRKILIIVLFINPFILFSQQYSDPQIKAAYIYNFIVNIEWPDENNFENFKIAVYGQDTSIIPYLKVLSNTKDVRGHKIEIFHTNDFNSVEYFNPQVLYITSDKNELIKSVFYDIITKPILLISDNSDRLIYVMLNFVNLENKVSFELNKDNILGQNLTILPKLLILGGTELDMKELYKIKEMELQKEKELVKQQELKLSEQQKLIIKQQEEIEKQVFLIEKRRKSIDSLMSEFEKQKNILSSQNENLERLQEEIILQQTILKQKLAVLDVQKDSIELQKAKIYEQKQLMAENFNRLETLNQEIEQRETQIEEQKEVMSGMEGTIKSQKRFIGLLIVIVALIIFIVIYVYRNFKQKKRLSEALSLKNAQIEAQSDELKTANHELTAQRDQLREKNEKIETQNEYITDSIKYATRIQFAVLPSKKELNKFFETFILFKPKDIVSGDFYWYLNVASKNNEPEKVFFAVVDCTGHGVPGALMSMIGNRLLSEIVAEEKIYNPADILKYINFNIVKLLSIDNEIFSDGMDAAICLIEKNGESYKATFSGAKRPLAVYNSETKKIDRYKGTNRSVGGYTKIKHDENFENLYFDLKKDDMIYMFTDGFIDQNNSSRKRYGTENFLNLLSKIAHSDVKIQHEILEKELKSWQGSEQQRDDITVMGIKLK